MDSVSVSHQTVVDIAAKIHEPSMQFPQYNCRVLYPRVSRLYETDDSSINIFGHMPSTSSGTMKSSSLETFLRMVFFFDDLILLEKIIERTQN
jgi:hypothetical protein